MSVRGGSARSRRAAMDLPSVSSRFLQFLSLPVGDQGFKARRKFSYDGGEDSSKGSARESAKMNPFDLNDFRRQLNTVKNLGSIRDLMCKIPGVYQMGMEN